MEKRSYDRRTLTSQMSFVAAEQLWFFSDYRLDSLVAASSCCRTHLMIIDIFPINLVFLDPSNRFVPLPSTHILEGPDSGSIELRLNLVRNRTP